MMTLFAACEKESLEDTYKEYAGEGEIRYMGKCTDLLVSPGWQRLIVTWENNVDPVIKNIKVRWLLDDSKDSVLLERGTTEYSIETLSGVPLIDGNYEISVCGVDANGNTSIVNTVFGRPYTYTHEEVVAFNRLISKIYIIRDRLILYFLGWQENMREASLSYTKADGSEGILELTEELCNQLYYMLPDAIDPTQPLILNRRGELPGCSDVIVFEPYTFSTDKVYDADIKQELKRQFGYGDEIPETWANSVETLYLDWSVSSFSDILNFPNLKKLVLGSNRYILPEAVNDTLYGQSKVADKAASDFALQVLHELNGLTVERYNKHYQNISQTDFIVDMGNTNEEPSVEFLDLNGLQFTEYPSSEDFDSGLANLTDGNYSTCWDPMYLQTYTTYELTLDLKTAQTLNGLRFVQKQFTRQGEIAIAPEYVKIKVSNNGMVWEDATYVEENPIGKTNGEISYISFSERVRSSQYRYVQVQINSGLYSSYYYSAAAEISLW